MADNNFRAQRKKHALDNTQLSISAPCPGVQGKWSSLSLTVVSNNPRFQVYTNDPNDQGNSYGKITANLNAPTFFTVLEILRQAIDFQPTEAAAEFKQVVNNKGTSWSNGKPGKDPIPLSELWIGKDRDGVVWISIISKENGGNRPKIRFPFNLSRFHDLRHGDGTPLTAAEVSMMAARAYLRMWGDVLSNILVSEYVEPKPKNPQGGGNGGGGGGNWNNNNRGGGGGGNGGGGSDISASSAGDDDIPW